MKQNIELSSEIRNEYPEIIKVYQKAFGGEPWYEKSKCVDSALRCIGGLSATAVGQTCTICELSPTMPAYPKEELVTKFESLNASKEIRWYIERQNSRIALAACAWRACGNDIVRDRYSDNPNMQTWLDARLKEQPVTYLDEVFAQKTIRPQGNLKNFESMCLRFMDSLSTSILCFRTINKAMVRAVERDFGVCAKVYERNTDVPDRRDFVIINIEGIKA